MEMSFGKRIFEILAVIGVLAVTGGILWYVLSGAMDHGYEKEGTLVRIEEARPAFVTDPAGSRYGEGESGRSSEGL